MTGWRREERKEGREELFMVSALTSVLCFGRPIVTILCSHHCTGTLGATRATGRVHSPGAKLFQQEHHKPKRLRFCQTLGLPIVIDSQLCWIPSCAVLVRMSINLVYLLTYEVVPDLPTLLRLHINSPRSLCGPVDLSVTKFQMKGTTNAEHTTVRAR